MSINYEAIIRSAMEQGEDLDTIMENFTKEANKVLAQRPDTKPQSSRGKYHNTSITEEDVEAAMKQEEEERKPKEEKEARRAAARQKWKPYCNSVMFNSGQRLPVGRNEYASPQISYLEKCLTHNDITNLLCYYICQQYPKYAEFCGEYNVNLYQNMTKVISAIDNMAKSVMATVEREEKKESVIPVAEDCFEQMKSTLRDIVEPHGYDSNENSESLEIKIAPKNKSRESAASDNKDGSYRIWRPVRTYGSFLYELADLGEILRNLWS